MNTILITGPGSHAGKTVLTLGIIRALKNKGMDISAFKVGPDFIDTKYLTEASGKRAGNLDFHLMGRTGVQSALAMNKGEFAIIEGAMGYFDGIYNTFENSSYDLSKSLNIPVVLVYTPEAEMFSAIPKIKGMVDFPASQIKGIILNRVSPTMYRLLKEQIEKYIGIEVFGYLPFVEGLAIDSRDSDSTATSKEQLIEKIADKVEETVDLKKIVKLGNELVIPAYEYGKKRKIKVAIAYDAAFNLYYNENLKLLENQCEVEYFSPLEDEELPDCDLVYIGGGYPEKYRTQLSNNQSMIDSIHQAAHNGKHIVAESEGFMYLVSSIGNTPMVGLFSGHARMTERFQRFGYAKIILKEETIIGPKGAELSVNESHKSLVEINNPPVFTVQKQKSGLAWQCGYQLNNVLAYYQRVHFLGNLASFNYLLDHIEKSVREI